MAITFGLLHIVFPIDDALPLSEVTMLITPLGNPASSAKATTAKAERGVSSAGRHTTVQPLQEKWKEKWKEKLQRSNMTRVAKMGDVVVG